MRHETGGRAEATTVRLASPDDAPAIRAIYAPIVEATTVSFEQDPPTVGVMRERITAGLPLRPWLVAEMAGAVVGFAYAGSHRSRPAYRWSVETSVYVAAEARRRGVGRVLYEVLLAGLRRQGYVTALAAIALPNERSVALHEAAGFRPAGVFRAVGYKFGAWHDVGWWRAELVAPPPPRPAAPVSVQKAWFHSSRNDR